EARGNHVSFPDRVKRPDHDFGYSPTAFAGGTKGEVGGVIWRDEAPAYYADRVGPLTLDDELEASGRLAFTGGLADRGACFGWFDAASKRNKKANKLDPPKNMLALVVEGPSRIGFYFRPGCYARDGRGALKETGPVIRPDGRQRRWSLRYTP